MQFHIVIANKINKLSMDVLMACSVKWLPHIYVNTTNGANLHIQCEKAVRGGIKSATKKKKYHEHKMDVAVSAIWYLHN